jgi:hypothetical protein
MPLVALLSLPLAVRALDALSRTGPANRNVFEQQVQMGRFFATFYQGKPIAINDLGAVAYLSSSRILDIVGLASQQVADLKRHRAFDRDALRRLADERQVEVIALYEDIFATMLPAEWVKVGEWTITDNVAVTRDTVAFFARTAADAERLHAHLDAFAPKLPRGVKWAAITTRVRPSP